MCSRKDRVISLLRIQDYLNEMVEHGDMTKILANVFDVGVADRFERIPWPYRKRFAELLFDEFLERIK